jgi:hypothetical protein
LHGTSSGRHRTAVAQSLALEVAMDARNTVVLATLVVWSSITPAPAKAQERVDLERIMSAEELSSTGLARLTATERRALELWLARYTSAVASTARIASPGEGAAPRSGAPAVLRLSGFPVEGGRVARSADGGSLVELEDGTTWQVYLPDRPRADAWEPGDFLRIERLAAPSGDYGFVLVRGPDRDRATVRFAGWVRNGQGSPSRPN